jgi:hypothetical protein
MDKFKDICKIGPDGICERHKIIHEGRYYNISQEVSSVGYHYRKKWDEELKNIDCHNICKIENGVCLTHKVVHEGRHHTFSQEQSQRGIKVRSQWNKIETDKKTDKGCGCNKKKGKLH